MKPASEANSYCRKIMFVVIIISRMLSCNSAPGVPRITFSVFIAQLQQQSFNL